MRTTTFRVELSDGRSFSFELNRPRTIVGRIASSDLVLDDLGVSREHALITLEGDEALVEDMGSTNGTRLNGRFVRQREVLADGDELLVGRALIRVQIGGAEAVSFVPSRPLSSSATVIKDLSEIAEISDSALKTLQYSEGEMQHREDENRALRVLFHSSRTLDLNLGPDELSQRIVDLAVRALEPDRVLLMLGEPGSRPQPRVVVNESGKPLRINAAITEQTLRDGASILTLDDSVNGGGLEPRSVLCVPLRLQSAAAGDRIVGLLYLDAPASWRGYSPRDLDLVSIIANHAGAVLENARLMRELREAKERLAQENVQLREEIQDKFAFAGILGDSGEMQSVLRLLNKVVRADTTVMLTGESGTGKELVARTIHYNSPRREEPFVAINCAAIPENLLEAELFGIEKGVATGVDRRPGKFEQAAGGTLFLDEIGEMPLSVQVKLLRVLEEREVVRLGGRSPIKVRARILAATNRNLTDEVAAGRFREDLYYRLNVVPIRLPAIRERPTDIGVLAEHFLSEFARQQEKPIRGFTPPALAALKSYAWPGNVRELKNEMERVVTVWEPVGEGRERNLIAEEQLADRMRAGPAASGRFTEELEVGDIKEAVGRIVERAEVYLIRRALEKTLGNRVRAAELLNLSREGLRKKMMRYDIS
ncbi:MAG: sigma 54-interacting transcriptional regulator [Candidatus Schekmanbacteria bacterium]|nr:sigma 54-interacting transcriptional regulator [Candidatus Schekmanbacteria bacterium]